MDIGTVNHEVDFCKVYDMETKEKVGWILLKNRISYFVEWEEKGLNSLLFFGNQGENLPASSVSTVMRSQKPNSCSHRCLAQK